MADYNILNRYTALGVHSLVAQSRVQPKQVAPMQLIRNATGLARTSTGALPSLFWELVTPVSIGLSAFHGYKRHNADLAWGAGWGILGGLFPIITPVIAFAQGFAKPLSR